MSGAEFCGQLLIPSAAVSTPRQNKLTPKYAVSDINFLTSAWVEIIGQGMDGCSKEYCPSSS